MMQPDYKVIYYLVALIFFVFLYQRWVKEIWVESYPPVIKVIAFLGLFVLAYLCALAWPIVIVIIVSLKRKGY